MDIAAENAYPTPAANRSFLPLLLMSLMTQKNCPEVTTKFSKVYDFIIVGAGSAGSVVASRLSEEPCLSVLLLEAGKKPPKLTDVPVFAASYWFSDIDWSYKTVPQKHAARGQVNNQVIWPSGKAVGGSSILNGMLYVRGNQKNYDDWSAQGAKGWSYEEVLPYFLKMEDNANERYVRSGYHATGGPMTVERPRYKSEIKRPIFDAAKYFGYQINDANGYIQTGFYNQQATLRHGQRCSTAKAYLVPAENRTNLDIVANAFVKKVMIKNGRATGVIFDFQGKTWQVKARKEVIMSAGTVNTAQLLMLSGIGPREHLEALNIPVLADLPVGKNLQDHCATVSNFEVDHSIKLLSEKLSDSKTANQYIEKRTGIFSSTEGAAAIAFLRGLDPFPGVDFPNYELYFAESQAESVKFLFGLKPEVYEQVYGPYEKVPFFICVSQILQPRSRGTVQLNSTDPYDPPLIDPNYYDVDQDIKDIVQGMKTCQKIGTSGPLQKIQSRPFETIFPDCEDICYDEDLFLECAARSLTITLNHQVGTAKMGDPRDPTTVVDPQLRVKGVQGLRIVDASVMPIVPSGNTNIPTIMIAEKASDMIKEYI